MLDKKFQYFLGASESNDPSFHRISNSSMPIAQQQPDIAPKTLSRMETVSDNLQTSSYASNLVLTRAAYRLRLAESREDLESAFRLRYLVFNLELNEGLESAHQTGYDTDQFDKACDHLIVEHRPTEVPLASATGLITKGRYGAG